jgi:prenyltransferase beta subunit
MTGLQSVIRRVILRVGLIAAVAIFSPPCAANAARRIPWSVESSGLEFVTPETQQSIDRGLKYLAVRQNPDGSFGPRSSYQKNVAVNSLCGMAFLSAGHTPGRGKYGLEVQKTVDFILSCAQPSGFIIEESSKSHGPMYGHAFATLFLAEVYGMSKKKEVRQALERAVKLIVNTQNREGGWRYFPKRDDADVSVTVCQVMALRAARNCGLYVPKNTIDKSVDYVKRNQNSDGSFRYQLVRRTDQPFPRSAAGVVALYSAGIYEGPEIDRGIGYLNASVPRGDVIRSVSHYFYGHYYAVQAMWHAGDRHWKQWYPAIRDELLRRQKSSGSWSDTTINRVYGTAMACLILQMPNNYLPIFQR